MSDKTGTYLLSVPNNGIGKTLISLLKRHLNTQKWHLKVRGRHPERAELAKSLDLPKDAFKQDVPLEHAQTLVVYAQLKEEKEPEEELNGYYPWNTATTTT